MYTNGSTCEENLQLIILVLSSLAIGLLFIQERVISLPQNSMRKSRELGVYIYLKIVTADLLYSVPSVHSLSLPPPRSSHPEL